MTSDDLAKKLNVLIELGPRLREAGYLEVELGDVRAELAPAAAADDDDDDDDTGPRDPFRDRATYGGRRIPRRADLHADDVDDA